MNMFPARIGPTVCELLGPTIWREKGSYLACEVELAPHPPPILKRSKVEMTACSGLSDPLSGPDTESLSL